MVPSTSKRVRIIAVLAAAISILTLAFPVAAAPRGTRATFTITPLIATVSGGQIAAIDVFARNDGQGTFTHATFVGTATAGTIADAPDGCAIAGATVTCSLGKLFSGESAALRILARAPNAAGTVTLSGVLTVDAGGDNSSASSRDTFRAQASIGVRTDPEFFGSWQPAHSNTRTFATRGIGGGNTQSTAVEVPPVEIAYPATIEETNAAIVCSGHPIGGFGKTVILTVANGDEVDPYLTWTMKYAKDAVGSRTPWTVSVVHQRDDGTCEFPPRGCHYHEGFCFDAFWQGYGDHKKLVIEMQLPANGRGRGL